jgi:hypothetical protein
VSPFVVCGWLPWQPDTTKAHADARRSAAKQKILLDLNADLVGWESGLLEMKVITPANPALQPFRARSLGQHLSQVAKIGSAGLHRLLRNQKI